MVIPSGRGTVPWAPPPLPLTLGEFYRHLSSCGADPILSSPDPIVFTYSPDLGETFGYLGSSLFQDSEKFIF